MVRKMGSSNLHRLLFTSEKSFPCCCLLHILKTDDINPLKTKCESSTVTGSLFGKRFPKGGDFSSTETLQGGSPTSYNWVPITPLISGVNNNPSNSSKRPGINFHQPPNIQNVTNTSHYLRSEKTQNKKACPHKEGQFTLPTSNHHFFRG